MARFAIGEVLGTSFRTVFRNFPTFLGTQGVVILAWLVVSLVVQLTVLNVGMDAIFAAAASGDMGGMFAALGPLLLASLVMLVGAVVAYAASTGLGIVAADAALRGERVKLADAWARVRPRFGNVLGTLALIAVVILAIGLAGAVGAILIVPFLAAIVAIFYFLVRWAVALPVSVLESQGVTGNLNRASELTKGSRGAILGLFVLLVVIILIPTVVVSVPLALMATPDIDPNAATFDPDAMQPSVGMQVVQWAVNGVIQLVSSFVGAALTLVLYRRLLPPEPAPAPPVEPAPAPVY